MKLITRCIVCGGNSFHELYASQFVGSWEDAIPYFLTHRTKTAHGRIVRCEECGFVFTNPQFESDEYSKIYRRVAQQATTKRQKRSTRRFERLSKEVRSRVGSGTLLDLGCEDDTYITTLGPGFDSSGYEIGEGPPSLENKTYFGDFARMVGDEEDWRFRFDVIPAWDVLEHLPTIREYMTNTYRSLKPGAYSFCTLPDITSWAARLMGEKWNCLLLEHLWYFNRQTLTRFLSDFGFDILEIKPANYPVDVETFLYRVQHAYFFPKSKFIAGWLGHFQIGVPAGILLYVGQKPVKNQG